MRVLDQHGVTGVNGSGETAAQHAGFDAGIGRSIDGTSRHGTVILAEAGTRPLRDPQAATGRPREFLFVAADIHDAGILLDGLVRPMTVVRLKHNLDPLRQMAAALAGVRGIEALHVVCHGAPGRLRLADREIGLHALLEHPSILPALHGALADGAEVVLYGCSVAAGTAGVRFVAGLAAALSVSVTASDMPVGHPDAGGSWTAFAGPRSAFNEESRTKFPGLLSDSVITFTGSTSGPQVTYTDAGSGVTATVSISDSTEINVTNLAGYFGTDGEIAHIISSISNTVTMDVTFNASVHISSFQFLDLGGNTGGIITFTPSTGSNIAITRGDDLDTPGGILIGDGGFGDISSWTTVTSFTISYGGPGATWVPGIDTITFTVNTNTAPAFSGLDAEPNFSEGGSAVVLDANVTVADTELDALNAGNGDYSGASLTIARNGAASASDVFDFAAGGGVTLDGSNLQSGGLTFATFTQTGGTLTVSFTSSGTTATSALVDTVLQNISYRNTNVTGSGTVTLDWTFNDGTTSSTGTNQVNVTLTNVTAASSNAGAFNTTTGANLSPGVVFDDADETLTIADPSHVAGSTIDGGGGTDTLVLTNGVDISGATITSFETLTVDNGASVTMTVAQHDAFTTINGAGTEQITFSATGGDTSTTGNAAIETYALGTPGITFTLGAAGQNVTGSTGGDTVDIGTLTATGTLNGGDGTDTLVMGNGASIAGATVGGFENLTLADNASVTMTAAQHAQFSGTVTAGGSETVNVTGNGSFTTLANVETYAVGDDTTNARTITVSGAGTSVTATSASDAVTFDLGTLTYTGTITGEGAVADTLSLGNGANIAGGTITGVANLTLANGASVTMTAAQLADFTGTVTAAGTETVTLTATGDVSAASLGAIETIATANDTAAQTITLTAIQAAGKTLIAGDAGLDHFVVTGSAGAQAITGSAGADTIDGGAGNDTIDGGAGDDVLSGGDGDDVISGGSGNDTLVGGAGNDTFIGSTSDFNGDTISDFAVGDSIVVNGADLSALNGTAASGTIDVDTGQTLTLTGVTAASGTFAASFTGGNTTITLTAPSSGGGDGGGGGGGGGGSGDLVISDSTPSNDTGGARTITNNGSSSGSAAIVQNTGNNGNVVTATLPPSISISSEGPSAAQTGDDAVQTLIAAIQGRNSPGEEGLVGGAKAFLDNLAATSMLDIRTIIPSPVSGAATGEPIVITGSSGSSQSEAFVIDMRSVPGMTLQLDNIEFASIIGNATVIGGAGDNYAVGDDSAQFISLGEGNDTLYGGDGADTIGSAGGDDLLYGDGGDDIVIGGTGNDTLFGGTGNDVVYGNLDADVLYGNQGNDTLYGGQHEDTLYGGQDADVLYGNLGADVLYGNLGADTLYGGQGNDVLYGGQGDDLLFGGLGDDTLYGGLGNDTITTGAGADLVVVQSNSGIDVVTDFDGAAGDRVQIAANVNGTGIGTYAELRMAAANDAGGNVVFALGNGNSLTLMGVNTSQLQSDWFSFG